MSRVVRCVVNSSDLRKTNEADDEDANDNGEEWLKHRR
jgi:hypothetical protein